MVGELLTMGEQTESYHSVLPKLLSSGYQSGRAQKLGVHAETHQALLQPQPQICIPQQIVSIQHDPPPGHVVGGPQLPGATVDSIHFVTIDTLYISVYKLKL